MALWCTGLTEEKAFVASTQILTKNAIEAIKHEIICKEGIENKKERAKIVFCCAKRVPRSIHTHPLIVSGERLIQKGKTGPIPMKSSTNLSDFNRLVGIDSKESGRCNGPYMSLYNFTKNENQQASFSCQTSCKFFTKKSLPPISTVDKNEARQSVETVLSSESSGNGVRIIPTNEITIGKYGEEDISLLSPLSVSQYLSISNTKSSSNADASSCLQKPQSSAGTSNFTMKVCEKATRKSLWDAANDRSNQEAWNLCEESAFILGTFMYHWSQTGQLPLVKFKDADDVADFINDGFELDIISGRQISDQVAKGNIGKVPKKIGRKTILPEADIKDFASLAFTALSIEQANSDANRLKKSNITSIVGNIVNTKRKLDGEEDLNDVALYQHIQKLLDAKCKLNITDRRELLCLKWLTYEQQKKHYI